MRISPNFTSGLVRARGDGGRDGIGKTCKHSNGGNAGDGGQEEGRGGGGDVGCVRCVARNRMLIGESSMTKVRPAGIAQSSDWGDIRFSGFNLGCGADFRDSGAIRRIVPGPLRSPPLPKSRPEIRKFVQMRALSAPLRAQLRLRTSGRPRRIPIVTIRKRAACAPRETPKLCGNAGGGHGNAGQPPHPSNCGCLTSL